MSRPSQSRQRIPRPARSGRVDARGIRRRSNSPSGDRARRRRTEHQSERRSVSRASGQAHSALAGGLERAAGAFLLHIASTSPGLTHRTPRPGTEPDSAPLRKTPLSTKAPSRAHASGGARRAMERNESLSRGSRRRWSGTWCRTPRSRHRVSPISPTKGGQCAFIGRARADACGPCSGRTDSGRTDDEHTRPGARAGPWSVANRSLSKPHGL